MKASIQPQSKKIVKVKVKNKPVSTKAPKKITKKSVQKILKKTTKKSSYQVAQYMTTALHTIGLDQTLDKAIAIMSKYKIRHIPVLNGGSLVGIISDRDLKGVMTLKDVYPEKVTVAEALTENLFQVKSDDHLADVCSEMANKKYGSALVVDNKKLVGIFTWVDALRAMKELLPK